MAKKDKEYRLCYVRDNVLYFTDNFEHQWGDDWDDITYSGGDEPYTWRDDESDEWNIEHHRGHFKHIGFYSEHESLRTPFDCGRYSIEDVNKKAAPWLYSDKAGGLMAGSTMDEAIEWCRKGKIKWGELTE